MILKASQRGGGKQLGQHLLRTDDNEHVELHDIRGFVSDDVVGALKEAYAVSRGTKCKQFLFSVSLSPPQQERVPVDTFEDAITRIEDKNGLTGHPRVIVFHEKEGRRHCHAVWSRIDAETMTAKNLSHFKLKLRDLSRELYIENGWKLPRGLMNSREADPRNFTLAEWQQARRMGRDARDLKALMQECWAASDSRASFAQALKARGITLAKGDRRGFVAVTHEGEALSVARYAGKKTKEIRARLGEPGDLPSVDEAKAQLAKDLTAAFQRHQGEAEAMKRRALSPLEKKRQHMTAQHRLERSKLRERQNNRWSEECRTRAARFDTGFKGIWSRITGKHGQIRKQNEREAFAAVQRDWAQRERLIDAQLLERQSLQQQIRAIRDRHAELLRDLRQDRNKVQALAPRSALSKEFRRRSAERSHGERSAGARTANGQPKRGSGNDFGR